MTPRWKEVLTGGDGWLVARECPACHGTERNPPEPMHAVAQNAGSQCRECTEGVEVRRFKTTAELRAFVTALPD